jgi:hypothetical protein
MESEKNAIKSYLENRKQRASLSPHILDNEKSSSWKTLTSGAPQGSIHQLFIQFFNYVW